MSEMCERIGWTRFVIGALILGGAWEAAWAWGFEGHRVIGELAWLRMTRSARAEVADLLAGEPPAYRGLAGASTWADAIKSQRAYDWAKPHHYVNIERGKATLDEARDCGSRGCLPSALRRHRQILEDPKAGQAQKREALKFYAHLVGDVHQPLHVGNREDRGGNAVSVSLSRWWPPWPEQTNLHRVWDSTLVERTGPSWQRRAARYHRRLSRRDVKAWQQGSEEDWINDTRGVFLNLGLADTPPGTRINRRYIARHQDVVEAQLQKAGVRLAAALNAIFGQDAANGR